MTLPNQITIARILLIPVFVVLAIYYGKSAAAGHPDEHLRLATLGVFLAAALSDGTASLSASVDSTLATPSVSRAEDSLMAQSS